MSQSHQYAPVTSSEQDSAPVSDNAILTFLDDRSHLTAVSYADDADTDGHGGGGGNGGSGESGDDDDNVSVSPELHDQVDEFSCPSLSFLSSCISSRTRVYLASLSLLLLCLLPTVYFIHTSSLAESSSLAWIQGEETSQQQEENLRLLTQCQQSQQSQSISSSSSSSSLSLSTPHSEFLSSILDRVSCPPGSFLSELAGLCRMCTPSSKNGECTSCSRGSADRSWSLGEQSQQLRRQEEHCVCPSGYYVDARALQVWNAWFKHLAPDRILARLQNSCTPCPESMYSPFVNSFGCKPCPADSRSRALTGSKTCQVCPRVGQRRYKPIAVGDNRNSGGNSNPHICINPSTLDQCNTGMWFPFRIPQGKGADKAIVNTWYPHGYASTLHVIILVYNPFSVESYYEHARHLIEQLNKSSTNQTEIIQVYIAELAFGTQIFRMTQHENPRHLQVRSKYLWMQKNNLLNAAIEKLLPPDWLAFAYLEGNLEFAPSATDLPSHSSQWVSTTLGLLYQCKDAVQLSTHFVQTGPNSDSLDVRTSLGFQYHTFSTYNPRMARMQHELELMETGATWAMSRSTYDRLGGFFPYDLSGHSDLVQASLMLGAVNCGITQPVRISMPMAGGKNQTHIISNYNCEQSFPSYHTALSQASHGNRTRELRIGFVPGALLLQHQSVPLEGQPTAAQLGQHIWRILANYDFDPLRQLQKDAQGILVPSPDCPPRMLEEFDALFNGIKQKIHHAAATAAASASASATSDSGTAAASKSPIDVLDVHDPHALDFTLAVTARVAAVCTAGSETSSSASSSELSLPQKPKIVPPGMPENLVDDFYTKRAYIPFEECARPLNYYWPLRTPESMATLREEHAPPCRPPPNAAKFVQNEESDGVTDDMSSLTLPVPEALDALDVNWNQSIGLTSTEEWSITLPLPDIPACPPPSDTLDALHEELKLFARKHEHNSEWTSSRLNVIAYLDGRAKSLLGANCSVEAFGSFATGLGTNESDLDLTLTLPHCGRHEYPCHMIALQHLLDELLRADNGMPFTLVSHDFFRVSNPLLRFSAQVKMEGQTYAFTVDISANNHLGRITTQFMKSMVYAFPALRPLTLFLKLFLHAHNFKNDLHLKGAMASYQLQVMLLFHLQSQFEWQITRDQRMEELKAKRAAGASASGPEFPNGAAAASSLFSESQLPDPLTVLFASVQNATILESSDAIPSTDASVFDLPLASIPRTYHLGYLLFSFFELFGVSFPYQVHGFRVYNPLDPLSRLSCFLKTVSGRFNPQRSYLLSFDESVSIFFDNGAQITRIRSIAKAFARARELIAEIPASRSSRIRPMTAGESGQNNLPIAPLLQQLPSDSVILASLLRLRVRYSVAQLKKRSLTEPKWIPYIEKYQEELQALKNSINEEHAHASAVAIQPTDVNRNRNSIPKGRDVPVSVRVPETSASVATGGKRAKSAAKSNNN